MRVHRLALSAFGPFAGRVEVDLDDAGRDGLFLLWGPTGAGKTTLLDAVVFALYGTVPGARGEARRLRSDHADAATRTEVSCELTLAGERLLVSRSPEQTRPNSAKPSPSSSVVLPAPVSPCRRNSPVSASASRSTSTVPANGPKAVSRSRCGLMPRPRRRPGAQGAAPAWTPGG